MRTPSFDVLKTLDPAPRGTHAVLHQTDILERIMADASADTVAIGHGVPPHRPRPIRWAVFVAAAAIIILGVAVGVTTSTSPTPRGTAHLRLASPWHLAADLVGKTYQLATGNPDAVVGVTCSNGGTCLLSTGYGLDFGGGGGMFASSDGGHSWSPSPLPSGMAVTTLASCPTDQWCAAGGGLLDPKTGDPAAEKPSRDPELLTTSNGGATWTVRSVPLPVSVDNLPAYENLPAETVYWPGGVDDVSCSAPQQCNVLGQVDNGPGGFVFLHTDDGGLHWTSSDLPEPGSAASYLYAMAPGNSETMSCPSNLDCVVVATLVSPQEVVSWRTTDGGQTWSEGVLEKDGDTDPSLSCPTTKICFSQSPPLFSEDGGLTWSSLSIPAFPPLSQAPGGGGGTVSCSSASTCVLAAGVQGLIQTTDGGSSWQRVSLPQQTGSVIQASCQLAGTCIAVANPAQGAILNGYDGGSLILSDTAP